MANASSQTETSQRNQATTKRQTRSEEETRFADDDLGKIQTILFGEQSNKFETQLADLTARFDRLLDQTNSEFTARINALETEQKRRIDDLNKELANKTNALDATKLDSKAAGRILSDAAKQIAKS